LPNAHSSASVSQGFPSTSTEILAKLTYIDFHLRFHNFVIKALSFFPTSCQLHLDVSETLFELFYLSLCYLDYLLLLLF